MTSPASRSVGIYIHVPFCVRKCLYCDFCSFPGQNEDVLAAYAARIRAELTAVLPRLCGRPVDTVYFGGGTPTLFTPRQIGEVLSVITGGAALSSAAEITMECNPATVDVDKLTAFRRAGVNRISIGVQSLCDGELAALGRLHSANDAVQTLADAETAGFTNRSVDLMFGIPGQTSATWRETLHGVLQTAPAHLSLYGLILEEGTPFWSMRDALPLPDEDTERAMYMDAVDMLAARGYAQYEISNFARDGAFSRHNYRYWNGDEYLGIGLSAHGYLDGQRYAHGRDLAAYLAGEDDVTVTESPDVREAALDYVMLRMRLCEGVDSAVFENRFGLSFAPVEKALSPYLAERCPSPQPLLYRVGTRWALTPAGFYVSNTILSDLPDAAEMTPISRNFC